ncbi:MAG: TolC family protein [Calditrichaeota bacterium]|nr:TolC family protein [Calditrichota bacterium]
MNKLITLTLMLGMTVSFSQEKLRLSEALAIALKNNIDIQIERNNHESNDEQVKIQFDSFLPKFNIRTGLSYQNESQANFVGTINVGNRTTDTTTYNAGLGINLQVNDIYGTVLSYVRALEVNDQSSENKTRNIQQIIKNVTNNFFNLAKQVALQQVRENAVKTNEQQVERAKSRFDIGSAAKKDIFTARVQLNNSKTALIQQKLQVEQAKNTLNIALGRNPYEAIEADIGSDLIANKYNNFEEIETEMLDKNPDLKSSRLSVDIAKTDLQRAANALYLPKVNVSAGYNKSVNFEGELNNTLSRLFDTGTDYSWSASLGLSYNFGMSSIYQNEQAEI